MIRPAPGRLLRGSPGQRPRLRAATWRIWWLELMLRRSWLRWRSSWPRLARGGVRRRRTRRKAYLGTTARSAGALLLGIVVVRKATNKTCACLFATSTNVARRLLRCLIDCQRLRKWTCALVAGWSSCARRLLVAGVGVCVRACVVDLFVWILPHKRGVWIWDRWSGGGVESVSGWRPRVDVAARKGLATFTSPPPPTDDRTTNNNNSKFTH